MKNRVLYNYQQRDIVGAAAAVECVYSISMAIEDFHSLSPDIKASIAVTKVVLVSAQE